MVAGKAGSMGIGVRQLISAGFILLVDMQANILLTMTNTTHLPHNHSHSEKRSQRCDVQGMYRIASRASLFKISKCKAHVDQRVWVSTGGLA
jgi:hypothetical protein